MRILRGPMAVLLLIGAGCGSGDGLPKNAYRNEAFGFGVVPPPGWEMVTPENAAPFIQKHGVKMLDSARAAMTSPVNGKTTFVVAFVKTDSADPIYPTIGVVHNSVGLPSVGAREKELSEQTLAAKVKQSPYWKAKRESSEIILLDGRMAVRIAYRGEIDQVHPETNILSRHPIRFVEVMVPSLDRTHFLSIHADPQDWNTLVKTFADFEVSFRSFGKRR
jgi:hypothetical protein